MVRPPPGLVTSFKEVASRAISTTKGGASKLARPALKFQRPIKPQARNSSSTASSSAAAAEPSFVQLLYQGVFTSVRSAAIPRAGPYTGQRLAARPPPPFRQSASGFSSAARPRPQPASRFGPTPRPTLYPTQTSQLGLGAARKFSSSGYAVFENVVHNAPLALRALADQGKDGLDERKWKKIRREIRKNEKTDVKGKGSIEGQRLKENVGAEFAQYFSVPVQAAEPISLLLVLDPEIPFASTSSSSTALPSASLEFDPSYRLLPASVLSVLDTFTQSYSSHAHRLRSLINRLSAAGLLDDPSSIEAGMYLDSNSGKRIWKVAFLDGFLTRNRIEGILRGYEGGSGSMGWESKVSNWNKLGKGEGQWWWIEGGSTSPLASTTATNISSIDLDTLSEPTPSTYLHSPVESTFFSPSSSSSSHCRDDLLNQSQSLVLPDPSSLDFSPPLSPSLEPTLWTSSTPSEFGFQGPEIQDLDAIESWSNGFEDEESCSSVSDWTSRAESEIGDEEEMDGVKQFLEEVERERERLGASWR
ncbi:hypothetical protein JCM3765_005081 [Sporobolomyces pararoseus]